MGQLQCQGLDSNALRRGVFLLTFFLIAFQFSFSQNTRPQKDTLRFSTGDTLQLSQRYLTPNSLRLVTPAGQLIPATAYAADPLSGQIVLIDPQYAGQDIVFSYRYFPRFLPETYALRRFRIAEDSSGQEFIVDVPDPGKEPPFIIPSNVKRSGSISRGITVGNNQSLAVSSGLRLELAGDLGDDLEIRAAITDENIPIQPDGTTQQIQDFDRVYIQLIRQNDSVILGDFEINHRGTQFANFYRNVQGIGIRVQEKNVKAGLSGAVAKGKFNTNSFQGEEGKQGPYRLTGENGERFIIVLAGSEKVYLNGQLVKRGEGFDYVMDYNSGELRFTSQQIISTASRIVVDFEYTDRFYNRSLIFADFGATLDEGRLKISGSYGRDADNQNAPIDGEFSDEALDSLRAAGDNLDLAFVSGVDSVGLATVATAIRYAQRDTVINGVSYERYVFASDSNAFYQVIFTNVGPGNGFYQRNQSLVNGTIFTWLPPDSSGQPTGSFAPIRVLVPASLHQVFDVKASYDIGKKKKLRVYTETAISSEDLNRQSPIDDDDNAGLANKTGIRLQGVKLSDSLSVRADVSHRFVESRYNNIDRVYKVEYGREWNFDDLGERLTENVTEGLAELRYSDKVRFMANAGVRTFGTRLFSFKQVYEAESKHKWIQGKYTFTTISTDDRQTGGFSRWDRHNGDVYKTLGNIRVGSEIWIEDKANTRGDSVQSGTFRFYDYKPYVRLKLQDKLDLLLSYNYRREYEYLDSLVRDKSEAHTQYMKVIWQPRDNLSLQNTSSLRRFDVLDTAFRSQNLENSQTFITNMQASYFTKNRLIFSNLIYEATSEQLARKQVAYIEVNPGQGDYEWTDLNEDGIQDLDEFQYSTNPNRSNFFSRIVVPTQELFPTTALNFSGNLKLDLKKTIPRSKNFFKETARNFLSISNFRVSQKKTAGTELENYLIDLGDIFADTSLLDAQYTIRQDFYFYRNNKVGDIKLSYVDNKAKAFLDSGTETRSLQSHGSNQRLNIGKSKSLENEVKFGDKSSFAQSFNTRNFNIDFIEVNPKMNFQINRKIRLTAGYTYKHKENTNDSLRVDAVVNLHKLSFDAKINLKERNNIFAKLDLVQIGQTGDANFAAEFELRETLEPGFNAVWQIFTTIYLTKTLELSVTYDGRASQDSRVLHTGRVQLKAFF